MANIVIQRTADLDHEGKTEFLSGTLFASENQAHTFSIGATRSKEDVALSGSVTGYFIRPDGSTVSLSGTIEDGRACVTLPQACYVQSGRFRLTIFVTDDGVKTAVYSMTGNIAKTTTGVIVDPGNVIPDVNDIIAEYDTMQQAVEDCEDAADAANTAAASVPEAIAEYSETLRDVSDNQIIENTDAAAFAYIPDAARAAAKGVDIAIAPVQAGTGDPSPTNIRAISGWTAVGLGRTGKNMLPKMVAGTYTERGVTVTVDANGVATLSGTATSTGNGPIVPLTEEFVIPKAGLTYCLNNSAANGNISPTIERSAGGGTNLSYTLSPANRQVTLAEGKVGMSCARIRFYVSNGAVASGTFAPAIMAEADSYEPNDGENSLDTIALPSEAGTVYGGTLHINEDGSGVLTVDHAYWTDDGSRAWTRNPGGSFFVASGAAAASQASGVWGVCNYAPYAVSFDGMSVFARSNGLISLAYGWGDFYSDVESLKAAFSQTPLQIVYPLATPTTYTLTAAQVALLKGANTIYADAGDTAVEYVADTKAYIDNKIAELQALILENI